MADDDNQSIEFVLEVEKYPCLYNNTLPSYSRRTETDKAWAEIAEIGKTMKMTGVLSIYLLIRLTLEVEEYPCLYNNTLPSYSRRTETDKAWAEIGKIMKMTNKLSIYLLIRLTLGPIIATFTKKSVNAVYPGRDIGMIFVCRYVVLEQRNIQREPNNQSGEKLSQIRPH
ncbi:alcohol dehydrogenase transcription factor myb/SANT-like domain-containing protein [Phthorimaea operculella]|nr:alcohol dehydrogenase transcription factor myb/SANT-like domain-containing protein [Phthorimaea operculella]